MSAIRTTTSVPSNNRVSHLASTDDRSVGARSAAALITLAKAARALHGLKLSELSFQNGQDELLIALDADGKTVSYVADTLDIRPSTVSKMVDRLEEKGLIVRIADPRDARRTMLKITVEGLAMRNEIEQAREGFGGEIAAALPDDITLENLEEFAGRLVKRLRRLR